LREGGWPLAPLIDRLMISVWNWLTDGAVVEKSALASLDLIIKVCLCIASYGLISRVPASQDVRGDMTGSHPEHGCL
jgi:hypothetical protein